MWMRIFSSDIRARYSLEVAPSATPGHKQVCWVVFLLAARVDNPEFKYYQFAHCSLMWVAILMGDLTVALSADNAKPEAVVAMNSNVSRKRKSMCPYCW